jgi:serine/threonine protein kinase
MSQCDNPITYKVFNTDLNDIILSENKKYKYLSTKDQAGTISGKNYILSPLTNKLPFYLLQNTNMSGTFGNIYDIVEIVYYTEGLFGISKKTLEKSKLNNQNKDPFCMKIKISKESLVNECKVIHNIYKNKNHRLLKNTHLLKLELVNTNFKKLNFKYYDGLILNSLRKMTKTDVNDNKKIYLLLKELELINNKKYLHNDIKADNILYDKDSNPVIIDFGSAVNIKYSGYSSGTILTMSPEAMLFIFENKMISTEEIEILKSDLYSLGSTIFNLLSKDNSYFTQLIFNIPSDSNHDMFIYNSIKTYKKIVTDKNLDNIILDIIKQKLNIKSILKSDIINILKDDINSFNINNITITEDELRLIVLYFMLQINVFERPTLQFIIELIELYNPKLLVKSRSRSRRKSTRRGRSSLTKKKSQRSFYKSSNRQKRISKRISANNLPILF